MDKEKLGPLNTVIGSISFMAFGVVGYMRLSDPLNKTNIIFGIIIGLLFGAVCKKLFSSLLSLLNSDVKQKHEKGIISKTVSRSTIFMFPYATLCFLSAYFLGWTSAGLFYSAAVMNTGLMAASEIGKLKEKATIKNTIVMSIAGTIISYLWLFSAGYLKNGPALIESAINLLLPLLGVKK